MGWPINYFAKIFTTTFFYRRRNLRATHKSRHCLLSDYNAKLHVLNLIYVICRKNLKYGNKRTMRVLDWCAEHQPQFERDMADGVAWTKLLNEFKAIGITFENLDPKMIEKHQRSFEVGVRHYDEGSESNDEV